MTAEPFSAFPIQQDHRGAAVTQTMKLFRVGEQVPNEGFVCLPYSIVRGERKLSLRAIGVLAYLLSHDNAWDGSVAVDSMASLFPEGKSAIKTVVDELEAAGYMHKANVKWVDGNARWVRFVTHDPAALASMLESGRLPFKSTVSLEYCPEANQVVRKGQTPEKRQMPLTGNRQEGSAEKQQGASGRKSARASTLKKNSLGEQNTSSGFPPLNEFVSMWQLLQKAGLVCKTVQRETTLQKAYARLVSGNKKFEGGVEALKDSKAVYDAIVRAKLVHGANWFLLSKLLSGENREGVLVSEQLMDGVYNGEEGTNGTEGAGGGAGGRRHGGAVRPQNSRVRSDGRETIESRKV